MKSSSIKSLFLAILISGCLVGTLTSDLAAEKHGVKYADNCEACKILAIELDARLSETGKSHEVLETGWVHILKPPLTENPNF